MRQIEINSFEAADQISTLLRKGETINHRVMRALVGAYGGHIRVFPDAPEDIKLLAVQNSGQAIRFIDHPSPAVQAAAIKNDLYAFKDIRVPIDHDIAKHVLAQAGHFIQYIPHPDCELQTIAAGSSWEALRHINAPCEAAQIAAVTRFGPDQLRDIKGTDVSEAVVAAAIRNKPMETCRMFDDLPVDLQRLALRCDPRVIKILQNYPSFDRNAVAPEMVAS